MYSLFLDTSNKFLITILVKNNEIIDSLKLESFQKQTELALKSINELLDKNSISLKNIAEVKLVIGPGSYTGVRVSITFAKTLKALNHDLKIYAINSLLFQSANKKVVSIISGYNNKNYLAVYDFNKEIISPQLVNEAAKMGIISDLKDYNVVEDYKNIDFLENFLSLQDNFVYINNIDDLQPLYIVDNFKKMA